MARGKYYYGPGFWKGPDWRPGAGGFHGGWYERGPGWSPGRGPCNWWYPGPGGYYGPAFSGPEEEGAFLKDQKERIKEELQALEQRLTELNEES